MVMGRWMMAEETGQLFPKPLACLLLVGDPDYLGDGRQLFPKLGFIDSNAPLGPNLTNANAVFHPKMDKNAIKLTAQTMMA